MHTESMERWVHDHTFGQDRKKSAEHRTLFVIGICLLILGGHGHYHSSRRHEHPDHTDFRFPMA